MAERTWKDKVIAWGDQGLSYQAIISKSRVWHIINKDYDQLKAYIPSSILNKDNIKPIFDHILDSYLDDTQKKVVELVKEIKEKFNENLSVSVIKRIRKELGLIKSLTRYGHSVRLANRAPRIAFCQFHLDKGTMFTAHCFTDESMVQVNSKGRFVFVRRGDAYRRVLPRHKHPACLMIWGGISWNGATPLVIIRRGTKVDGGVYQTMIH
ncbi:hypothetical protein PENTCL1PPCAC_26657, partial [Pristionchus entomophagus]